MRRRMFLNVLGVKFAELNRDEEEEERSSDDEELVEQRDNREKEPERTNGGGGREVRVQEWTELETGL